jgi:hypothetical protein
MEKPRADGAAASNERYMARGVSASKEDVHAAIANVDKGLFPKAFCKIVPDIAGDPEWCTCMHADGAGTKTSLAYMYWKETGDLSVWHGVAQDSVVMNTDDLLCIGCVDNILLSSTIGRNKALIPAEVLSALIGGTEVCCIVHGVRHVLWHVVLWHTSCCMLHRTYFGHSAPPVSASSGAAQRVEHLARPTIILQVRSFAAAPAERRRIWATSSAPSSSTPRSSRACAAAT